MNFFAHAVFAARRSDNPRWVLGAMLPDFFTMAGLRLEAVAGDQPLQGGIDFHHATDEVFHTAPLVVEMMEAVTKELAGEGLDRGPSMAIGHVGVELLLDGVLVDSEEAMNNYRFALDEIEQTEMSLRFAGLDMDEGINRWRRVTRYLPTAPIPEGYAEPDFVAERLIRILANRPYLAVPKEREDLVFSWARRAAPQIEEKAKAVLTQVEDRLIAAGK